MRNLRSRWLDIGQVILHVFMDRDELRTSIKTQKRKKERGQYSAIKTENLAKKGLREKDGKKAGLKRAHLARPGSQSEQRKRFIFLASGSSHIL